MNKNQLKPKYYPGIDALKGCLILQVILTHALGDNNIRFLMYTYHMPLFMAVSGFLIKRERLQKLSLSGLFHKYFHRLIIPWTVAFVFYNVMVYGVELFNLTLIEWVEKLIYPYYHLWFIPALLFMIFLLWVVEKLQIPPLAVLLGSLCITVLWFAYFQWIDLQLAQQNLFYHFLGDKRSVIYFFFFFLSYSLKNFKQGWLGAIDFRKLAIILLVLTPLLVVSNYLKGNPIRPYYYTLFYLLFNVTIIYTVLSHLINVKIKNAILQFSNNYSMAIYLYHYIILTQLHEIIGHNYDEGIVLTTYLFVGTSLILLPAIKLLSSIPAIDLIVFGNTKRLLPKTVKENSRIQQLKTLESK